MSLRSSVRSALRQAPSIAPHTARTADRSALSRAVPLSAFTNVQTFSRPFAKDPAAPAPLAAMLAAMMLGGRAPWVAAGAQHRKSYPGRSLRLDDLGARGGGHGGRNAVSLWAHSKLSSLVLPRSRRVELVSPFLARNSRARARLQLAFFGSALLLRPGAASRRPRRGLVDPAAPALSVRRQLAASHTLVDEPPTPLLISSQSALLGSALGGLVWVVAAGWDGFVFWTPELFMSSLPSAIVCFGAADLVAQRAEGRTSIDLWRTFSSTLVGVGTCAGGFMIWVHYLHILIPSELVTGGGGGALALLASKALIDSFVWGTTSNSAGFVARRLLAGDSPAVATKLWRQNIWQITANEFKFWPVWQMINFYLVPAPLHVSMTALGAFVWNIYMSMLARQAGTTGSRQRKKK